MQNQLSFDDYMRWRGWADGNLPADILERLNYNDEADDFCDDCTGCQLELHPVADENSCWIVQMADCIRELQTPGTEQIKEVCRTVLWAFGGEA